MLFSGLWLLASAATVASTTLPNITLVKPEDFIAKLSTHSKYIVQLSNDASLTKRAGEGTTHEQFHKRASLAGLDYTVRKEFTNEKLFYGVSIQLSQNMTRNEVKGVLNNLPEVQNVWPIRKVPKPSPAAAGSFSAFGNAKPSTVLSSNGSWTPVDDSPVLPQILGANVASTHAMAGVDKLHALGIKGKGLKIGLVDTGIDYRHPSLGGGFGPGFKVAGGYTFVDDNWDGTGDPVEGPDPLSTCSANGHGTHTSGIIGMQDPADMGFGLSGVAPEASLYMYKVFSCLVDETEDDYVMQGMMQAAQDEVDILSMSLGFTNYFEADSPFNDLVSAINDAGTAVVVSNGNDGDFGVYAESSPADAPAAFSVGSITNDVFPVVYTGEDSTGEGFWYGSVWPLEAENLTVYYHGSDCTFAAWEATGDAVAGSNTTIVIAEIGNAALGGCALATQMSGASEFAISYLLAYNLDSLDPSPFGQDIELSEPFPSVATIVLNSTAGAQLVKKYLASNNESLTLSFTSPAATSMPMLTGGTMSNFSSFGPSWDTLLVKPSVSAPGGKILSTWPLGPSGGYAIISGTSMAAPFVAGCFALVKSQFPKLTVDEIANLLQSAATPVPWAYDRAIYSSVAQQGAGLINAYNAIFYGTLVTPSQVSAGDLDAYTQTPFTITITNYATTGKKIFEITHQGAGYVEVFPYPDLLEPNDWNGYGQPQYATYATARFSQTRITVHAGETLSFRAYIAKTVYPADQLAKTPLTSGFFQLSTDTETHTIPYIAVPYSRQKTPAIDTSELIVTQDDGTSYTTPQPFVYCGTCAGDRPPNTGFAEYNGTLWDFPAVWYNFLTGFQQFQTNIVPANTTFKPTHNGGSPPRNSGYKYMDPGIVPHDTWLGMPSYGWVPDNSQTNNDYPVEDTEDSPPFQSSTTFLWGAAYYDTPDPDGTSFAYLPNGDYRFLVSLLKPGSNASIDSEWETYLSPVVRLVGTNF